MSQSPFLPTGGLPALPDNAKATAQLGRLLDALLILEVERSSRVDDLAVRVGLNAKRLRALLSSFMVAGADIVGTAAPSNISFSTEPAAVAGAPPTEVVHVSDTRATTPLLDDVGRRAVTLEEVVRGLLTARALLAAGAMEDRHRAQMDVLVSKLEAAMQVTVTSPIGSVTAELHAAAAGRHRVRFRYRDPWTGQVAHPDVEAYAVRRRRDRYYLDAGADGEFWSYDLSAVSDVEVDRSATFADRPLPAPEERERRMRVVLRVPKDSAAEQRLCQGWDARVVGPPGDGQMDLAIQLDRTNAEARLGVLVLQLGPPCAVVEPAELRDVAAPVAERLLITLSSSDDAVHGGSGR